MGIKIIERNKRASYDYHLHDKYEAGLQLQGTEVKTLRQGKVKISDAYIIIDERTCEAFILNMTIPHYEFGNRQNHEETRKRKLLLHKAEINEILHRTKAEGLGIVPTQIYFKDARVKIEFALAKGKKLYDKRADQAKKDVDMKLKRGQFD
jgi:SsrA-binding protein